MLKFLAFLFRTIYEAAEEIEIRTDHKLPKFLIFMIGFLLSPLLVAVSILIVARRLYIERGNHHE